MNSTASVGGLIEVQLTSIIDRSECTGQLFTHCPNHVTGQRSVHSGEAPSWRMIRLRSILDSECGHRVKHSAEEQSDWDQSSTVSVDLRGSTQLKNDQTEINPRQWVWTSVKTLSWRTIRLRSILDNECGPRVKHSAEERSDWDQSSTMSVDLGGQALSWRTIRLRSILDNECPPRGKHSAEERSDWDQSPTMSVDLG